MTRTTTDATTIETVTAELARAGATLLRAWPRSSEHLLLEVERDGTPCAGQWFAEEPPARRVHAGTPGSERVGRTVLQPGGADRKLAGLADRVRAHGAELVAHRPERRGVVRVRTAGTTTYTKVVRPAALDRLVAAAETAQALPLRTPQLLAVDVRGSAVTTGALPGVTLHALLGSPRAVAACRATGAALAALHAVPVPPGTALHGPGQELTVLARWAAHATEHGVPTGGGAGPVSLPALDRPVLLHRDLHDKQVLVDADGTVGVLDFDLLAAGDPALDLGNLLAHLDLRVAQGLLPDATALRAAVLAGYDPSPEVLARVPAHERATRARLACVYAFRPRWAAAAAGLAAAG